MADKLTSRATDYSKWYNEIVHQADLAEHSDVKGCMVIKPYGYAIWENMQKVLDQMFKDTGHSNAYFPLFIPKSFFAKEASHVDGFAKECAVVTHYRLKNDGNGGIMVDPDAKLEEELIVRPTSETIIWNTYRGWIQSYRDLPILVNQWANVVRWEMRTRLFLRTSEFLWQEGHTAHATADEAIAETKQMLEVYATFAEDWMAVPVMKGAKSPNERFAGALDTYCIEALMQDGKALQAGTSHFLGQNFAKAFDVKFTNKEGKIEHVWASSWGVSTRLIGALIMAHSDDEGLVLPPKLAPIQVVIVPIFNNEEALAGIRACVDTFIPALKAKGISVKFDDRDTQRPGYKFAEWELKGVPVRLAIGPRDIESGSLVYFKRCADNAKTIAKMDEFVASASALLTQIRDEMLAKADKFREDNTREIRTLAELEAYFAGLKDGQTPGFVITPWEGFAGHETAFKEKYGVTVRCHPFERKIDGKMSAVWAQSY